MGPARGGRATSAPALANSTHKVVGGAVGIHRSAPHAQKMHCLLIQKI